MNKQGGLQMSYIDILRESKDMVTHGMSACQGCGAELILRRVLQLSGENTIVGIPPGCLAGAGVVGWNLDNGLHIPVHITLLDNTAALLTGVSNIYERKGLDTNIVAIAGDGATADCGFQSLSGAAERGEKMLYICYDNEGYMNTGFQRSSASTKGSMTSTTPVGSVIKGKEQHQKYMPLIMAMHNAEYVATASPSNMKDLTEKVQKGLEASKRGFAYLHIFSPCPTGWGCGTELTIDLAKKAVKSNLFPLFEVENGKWKLLDNKNPIPVSQFTSLLRKFKHLTPEDIAGIEKVIEERMNLIRKLASN
jgi:pyruvate/2-oxoacid:ferredoxin oxidoreductase beta subunit